MSLPLVISTNSEDLEEYELEPVDDPLQVQNNLMSLMKFVKETLGWLNKSLNVKSFDIQDLIFLRQYCSKNSYIFHFFHLKSELDILKKVKEGSPERYKTMLIFMLMINALITSAMSGVLTEVSSMGLKYNVRMICSIITTLFTN